MAASAHAAPGASRPSRPARDRIRWRRACRRRSEGRPCARPASSSDLLDGLSLSQVRYASVERCVRCWRGDSRDTRTRSTRQRSRARGHRTANPADADSQFRRRAHHCRTHRCQPPAAVRRAARAAPRPHPAASANPTKVIASPVADRARATISREHSHNRQHDIAPAARFRFQLSLQRGGSGSGKSIKICLRSVACPARPTSRHRPTAAAAPSFCSIAAILPSRPARATCRRAQRRSRMARLRPPRQRREASLTAASTTAGSIASGLRSPYPTNKPSKGGATPRAPPPDTSGNCGCVVGDAREPAIVAALDMTAERRRAAGRDRADHAPLDTPEMSGVRSLVTVAVAAKDVGQFERRPNPHRTISAASRSRANGIRSRIVVWPNVTP